MFYISHKFYNGVSDEIFVEKFGKWFDCDGEKKSFKCGKISLNWAVWKNFCKIKKCSKENLNKKHKISITIHIFLTSQVDRNIWCCWYSSKFASITLQRHYRKNAKELRREMCVRAWAWERETYRSLLVTWWKTCVEKYLMFIIIIIKNNIIHSIYYQRQRKFSHWEKKFAFVCDDIKLSLNNFLFDNFAFFYTSNCNFRSQMTMAIIIKICSLMFIIIKKNILRMSKKNIF